WRTSTPSLGRMCTLPRTLTSPATLFAGRALPTGSAHERTPTVTDHDQPFDQALYDAVMAEPITATDNLTAQYVAMGYMQAARAAARIAAERAPVSDELAEGQEIWVRSRIKGIDRNPVDGDNLLYRIHVPSRWQPRDSVAVRAALGPAVPVPVVLEYVDRRNEWDQALIDRNHSTQTLNMRKDATRRMNAA